MSGKRWFAVLSAVATMGLAVPAFADHVTDQDLNQRHAYQQRDAVDWQHQQWHARESQKEYWRHETGNGWGPRHWFEHRRAERRHAMEHMREKWEHTRDHADLGAHHDHYHEQTDPYYGGYYRH